MGMTDYLNSVADTFQITLRKAGTKVSGHTAHSLTTIVPGTHTAVHIRVVDSLLYDTVGTSGVSNVLIHIGGDLYCYALCEHKGQNITKLFFLDGSKLGFKPKGFIDGDVSFFPKLWSRREIFKKMVDGIVACYWKLSGEQTWTEATDVKAMIKQYVEQGLTDVAGIPAGVSNTEDASSVTGTAADLEVSILEEEGGSLSKKLEDMSDEEYAAFLDSDGAPSLRLPDGNLLDCGEGKNCNWVEDINDFWCVECGLTSGEIPELDNLSLDQLRDSMVAH